MGVLFRYRNALSSTEFNLRFADMLGNSILSGFYFKKGTNPFDVTITYGKDLSNLLIMPNGARIEDNRELRDVLNVPVNTYDVTRIDSVYIHYVHGLKDAQVEFVLIEGDELGEVAPYPEGNEYTLLGYIHIPQGASSLEEATFEYTMRGINLKNIANEVLFKKQITLNEGATSPLPTKLSEVANKEYVDDEVSKGLTSANSYTKESIDNLVNGASPALDTLRELSQALGDDPNFATTVSNELAKKETPEGAQEKVDTHANNLNNPHKVTSAQVNKLPDDSLVELDELQMYPDGYTVMHVVNAAYNPFAGITDGQLMVETMRSGDFGIQRVTRFNAEENASLYFYERKYSSKWGYWYKILVENDLTDSLITDDSKMVASAKAVKTVSDKIDNLQIGGKNLISISAVSADWEYTADATYSNKARNDGSTIFNKTLPKGDYIISFSLLKSLTSWISFSYYEDDEEMRDKSFVGIKDYEIGKVYTKNISLTTDKSILIKMWGNSASQQFEFKMQLEKGHKATDFRLSPDDIDNEINKVDESLSTFKTETNNSLEALNDVVNENFNQFSEFKTQTNDSLTSLNEVVNGHSEQLTNIENAQTLLQEKLDTKIQKYDSSTSLNYDTERNVFINSEFKVNDVLIATSAISDFDTEGRFQTLTCTYYEDDGTTVKQVDIWNFTYDEFGNILTKTKLPS